MREDVAMDREEFWVHCEACQHEWIALYTPMEMGIVAKILKGAHCPMCATNAKQIATGKYPHATPQGDPLAWIAGGDTGKSSKTMFPTTRLILGAAHDCSRSCRRGAIDSRKWRRNIRHGQNSSLTGTRSKRSTTKNSPAVPRRSATT